MTIPPGVYSSVVQAASLQRAVSPPSEVTFIPEVCPNPVFQATLILMKPLRRVAVLGAGTMGSRIAAHLANAGFPVDLLDIVRPDNPLRNAAALAGIET